MSFIKLIILVGICLDLEENPLSFLKKEYTKKNFSISYHRKFLH